MDEKTMKELAGYCKHNENLTRVCERVLVGGNHLALHIGTDHPPYCAEAEEAVNHYGGGIKYDIWCCWKTIMQLRDAMK